MLLCQYLTLPRVSEKVLNHSDVYDISALKAVAPKPGTEALLPRGRIRVSARRLLRRL